MCSTHPFQRIAAALPALLLLAALPASPSRAASDDDDMRFDLQVITQPTVSAIVIDGAVVPPLADAVATALAGIPKGKRVVVDLNSPGGDLDEGEDVIAAIKAAKKNHRIDTMVNNGHLCLSMCVAVFLAGDRRFAARASVFMLHAAHMFGSPVPIPKATKRYLKDLTDAGASDRWLRALESKHHLFTRPAELWLTGQELIGQHANIATDIMSNLVVYDIRDWSIPPLAINSRTDKNAARRPPEPRR